MAKQNYVDSAKLESDWYNWLVSSATPSLEPYRTNYSLWTKVTGRVMNPDGTVFTKSGEEFVDPSSPLRTHRIYFGENAIEFSSKGGDVEPPLMKTKTGDRRVMPLECTFAEQFSLHGTQCEGCGTDEFILEVPTDESWQQVLGQISQMCTGIAMTFNMKSDEDRHDLGGEALLQVASKLKRGKLIYTPGQAPVFNLLTTTIHRCMYSILSRISKQQRNIAKLVDNLSNGAVPATTRSLCMYSDKGNKATNTIKPR